MTSKSVEDPGRTPPAAVAVVRALLDRKRCACRPGNPDEAQRVVAELELEGWRITRAPDGPAGTAPPLRAQDTR